MIRVKLKTLKLVTWWKVVLQECGNTKDVRWAVSTWWAWAIKSNECLWNDHGKYDDLWKESSPKNEWFKIENKCSETWSLHRWNGEKSPFSKTFQKLFVFEIETTIVISNYYYLFCYETVLSSTFFSSRFPPIYVSSFRSDTFLFIFVVSAFDWSILRVFISEYDVYICEGPFVIKGFIKLA